MKKFNRLFALPVVAGMAVLGAACGAPENEPMPDQPGGVPTEPGQAPNQPTDPTAPGQPGNP